MSKQKLHIGCGTKIKEGFINLDKIKARGVDVVHDMNTPLFFEDNKFDYILIEEGVLEILDNYEGCIQELKRILKTSGILEIQVSFNQTICSELRKRYFRYNSFCLDKSTALDKMALYKGIKIIKRKIEFEKYFPFYYNYFCEFVFNLHPTIAKFYEKTCLRYLFPARNIRFFLKKETET